MSRGLVIAIDGPAASGKSTTAKRVAAELGCLYIDTGAMYRAATLAVIEADLIGADEDTITDLIRQCSIDQISSGEGTRTFLNGRDVSDRIRERDITLHIDPVASNPKVRECLVARQQEMGQRGNVILDGRDIGTVVFPDADVKFFMIADVHQRAERRFREFQNNRTSITLEQVIADIKARDLQDQIRGTGALKQAPDAVLIDTTRLSIDEQVALILETIATQQQGQHT